MSELQSILQAEKKSRKRWFTWLLLLVLLGGGGYYYYDQQQKEASALLKMYQTETLKKGDLELDITATGNLEPTNEVTIGSELSGITLEVYVDTNDQVKKGQPLAKLDTTKLEQQLLSARASVDSSRSRVAQAEATLKEKNANIARIKELHRISSGKAVSSADLDTGVAEAERALADLGNAKASVGESEAQVKIIENDLKKAIIISPIDGVVLTRSLEPGQTVAASFTAPELFVIAEDLKQMKLEIAVAEADIGMVKEKQTAQFMVDAWPNRIYQAHVQKVGFGSVVTDKVVTYVTELKVNNDDLSLRPGMTATADVRVATRKDVFLVPGAALRFKPEPVGSQMDAAPKKSFVQSLTPMMRRRGRGGPPGGDGSRQKESISKKEPSKIYVEKDGEAVPIEVTVGLNDGRFTEVSGEGLREGMSVILRSNLPSSR